MGLFTCHKLANLSQNFVTETCKRHPETTRCRLCCEKLGTSHDVKGFAIGSFLKRIIVERANDDLCQKNVKNAGLILWLFSTQISLEINRFCAELAFFTDCFLVKFASKIHPELPQNWPIFREFVLKNPAKLAFSSTTCQKPCYRFTQKLLVGIDCVTDK